MLDNAVGTINGQEFVLILLRNISALIDLKLLLFYSYLYSLSETSETIQVYRLNSPGKAEFWQSYSFAEDAVKSGLEIGKKF